MLNLGSGDCPAPAPWVNVDKTPGPEVVPDVGADALSLPYDDQSVRAVYCGHLLEHLTAEEEVPRLLAEVRRVLRPNGRACFVGPDHDRALANPFWAHLDEEIRTGGCRWPGDEHRWTATGPKALEMVRTVFPAAEEVEIGKLAPFWPVYDRIGWQFAIVTRHEGRRWLRSLRRRLRG